MPKYFCLWLLLYAFSAQAKTYYADSAAGDDLRAGTSPGTSWKSLAKINGATFIPGDTLLLKCGSTWIGQLWPKGSGTEKQIITLGKYGAGSNPLIEGRGQVEDTFLLKNQEYWEVSDLEFTNHAGKPAVRRGVHVAGENFGELHQIYLRSLTVHDVSGADSSKENGGIIYTSDGKSKPTRFVDIRVENNHVFHTDRNGISGWSTHWPRSSWYPSLGVVVRGNRLEDIGGDGIMIAVTDGALIEHNVVAHANQRSEGYNIAIWSWSTDNTIIQFNEAYGTSSEHDGEGFDSDWNSRNTLIQYNYSHDNEGGFLLICNSGETGPENIGNIGTVARYNISQNDHNRGINLAGPIKDTLIYNNTIYVGKFDKTDALVYSDWFGWAENTSIFNNIFYVEGEGKIVYGTIRDKLTGHHTTAPGFGKSTGNRFDSNTYFSMPAVDDPHAMTSDPMFVHRGDGPEGYALRPKSPAIDSAKSLDDQRDYFGTAVPSCDGVDRGAVESPACDHSNN
jgi:hypothetical protein